MGIQGKAGMSFWVLVWVWRLGKGDDGDEGEGAFGKEMEVEDFGGLCRMRMGLLDNAGMEDAGAIHG